MRFTDPIWANRDFTRLWVAQGISQFGSQVTILAVPLIAIGRLHGDSGDVGLLQAAARAPFLLYLVAGVWIDRVRRRPVLIGTDLGRGALLLAIPVAAWAGGLSLGLLAVVLVAAMTLAVWFDTAYMSYLPALVDRSELMAGNTRMETSRATAQAAGPGVAGVLVQALTAPVAVLVDSASFLVSALFVSRIRSTEAVPPRTTERGLRPVLAELRAGIVFIGRDRLLRPLALGIGISNLAWAAELAVYIVFLVRGLHLPPSLVGLSLVGLGPGAVVGSAVAGRVSRRYGLAAAIIGGLSTFATAAALIPLAPRHDAVALPMLLLAGFAMSVGGQVCAVNVLTARQRITPDELLGRVNASFRFLAVGVTPLGSLAGGFLGTQLGLRPAIAVSVAAMFAAPVVIALSPARRVRDIAEVATT